MNSVTSYIAPRFVYFVCFVVSTLPLPRLLIQHSRTLPIRVTRARTRFVLKICLCSFPGKRQGNGRVWLDALDRVLDARLSFSDRFRILVDGKNRI